MTRLGGFPLSLFPHTLGEGALPLPTDLSTCLSWEYFRSSPRALRSSVPTGPTFSSAKKSILVPNDLTLNP